MDTRVRTAPRNAAINIRAQGRQRDLIDRAAESLGKTRSEFMLDSACREAQHVLLDRTTFTLEPAVLAKFARALDAGGKRPNPKLEDLTSRRTPWK